MLGHCATFGSLFMMASIRLLLGASGGVPVRRAWGSCSLREGHVCFPAGIIVALMGHCFQLPPLDALMNCGIAVAFLFSHRYVPVKLL